MPEPVRHGQRYMPGLDGLRAVAVLAVLAYHLDFAWASGGLLGVGVFFTLSGYLITDLLLAQASRGGMRFGDFWAARARRLLPALLLMLAVVVVWVVAIGPGQPAEFGDAVVAAALYVSNWQLIFQHVSYFASFGPPSPLNHLWSLGVEEQFYIVWPLLLALGLRCVRERSWAPGLRPRLATLALLLAAASAIEMAILYQPSLDPSRVYYGTDTRAFALLIGAALAMVWPSRRLRADVAAGARRSLDALGSVGLIAIVVMVWRTTEYSAFLYRGGFVLLAVATSVVVAALVHPACRLGRVLAVGSLRWIGVRSYGIYLWQVPIIVLTTPADDHGTNLGRDALQVAATLVVAALSWRFVEQPIRHGALGRAWRRARSMRWQTTRALLWPRHLPRRVAWTGSQASRLAQRPWRGRRRGAIATLAGGTLAVLLLASVAIAEMTAGAATGEQATPTARPGSLLVAGWPSPSDGIALAAGQATEIGPWGATEPSPIAPTNRAPSRRPARPAPVARTSCRAVVHIGDSTSEGLTSPDYLPDPALRISAQYARVGVQIEHFDISGARSIVETYDGYPNAYTVAQGWKRLGYRGCWVLALGTNDTANVYVGSNVGRLARIRRMMSVIGDQPVMWVNVKSLLPSGPYSEQNMELWDEALVQACREYPNMRVFDWAAVVKDSWFIDDGIHYNTPGYAARSRLIAQALASAFPAHGRSAGCVVR